MQDDVMIVRLALEDGSIFEGRGFGACAPGQPPATRVGEVVFNTAMTGYQESLTDPSYAGQILTMTAPLIGNYGVNTVDVESSRPQVAGYVVRELSRLRSNYRASEDLSDWLAEHGIPGLREIDTRALVRRLRIKGAMRGVISSDHSKTDEELVELARQAPTMSGQNLAAEVSVDAACNWDEPLDRWMPEADGETLGPAAAAYTVVALDCGGKRNIYKHLVERGCRVRILPFDTPAETLLEAGADGLFISNGPGDPAAVRQTIDTLRSVAGRLPTFGICLGHQLLSLALGATTYKLKFGHRGANQPVRNLITGRVEITSQNHGFAVDADSLTDIDCELTHVHLNDGTVSGIRHRSRPIFSVQHHPEASPGPHDASYLFDCFIEMMRTGRPLDPDGWRTAQCGAGGPKKSECGVRLT